MNVFPLYIVCTSRVPFQRRIWHWKDWYCTFGQPLKSSFSQLMISLLAPLCWSGYMLSHLVPWTSIANHFANSEPRLPFSGQCKGLVWSVPWLTVFSTSPVSFFPRGKVLRGFGLLIFLSTSACPVCQLICRTPLAGFGPNKTHRLMCYLKDCLQPMHLHWWTPLGEVQLD